MSFGEPFICRAGREEVHVEFFWLMWKGGFPDWKRCPRGIDGWDRVFKVGEVGVWPQGFLDAYIAMNSKMEMSLPWVSDLCVCLFFRMFAGFGHLPDLLMLVSVLGLGLRCRLLAWYTTVLDTEDAFSAAIGTDVLVFVTDVVKYLDTLDCGVFDCVLSSFGLSAWFRHTYFDIMHMFGFGSSCRLVWEVVECGMEESPKDVVLVWFRLLLCVCFGVVTCKLSIGSSHSFMLQHEAYYT